MKRILHIVSCLERGGTEAFIMNNYRQMNRDEIQFDFLVFNEKDTPYVKEIQEMGGRVFFGCVPALKNIRKFLKITQDIIQKNGPFIAVHSHVNIANCWGLLVAKKVGVKKRVSHSHAKDGKENKKIYRKIEELLIKRTATDCLACSKDAGDYLYGRKYFKKHGRVLRNGICVKDFFEVEEEQIEKLKAEFLIDDNVVVLGNITRMEETKNTLFTIRVFSEIKKLQPNAILLLGGPDGGLLSDAKKLVKELNVENSVRFIGVRTDIPACLRLIDIYLFPSKFEGLGIVALEAQASGCLCVASTGVPKEADMEMGTMHFIELSQSEETWANRIKELYDQKSTPTKERIENAFLNAGYNIENTSKELLKIYEG